MKNRALLSVPALALLVTVASAADYDAVSGFHYTTNPDGVWSYGYALSTGAYAFVPMDQKVDVGGIDSWRTSNIDELSTPLIGLGTGSGPYGGVTNALTFHNADSAQAVLRFTALEASHATLDGTASNSTNNVTLRILKNGVYLLGMNVGGTSAMYSTSTSLLAGDTLDFTFEAGFGTSFKSLGATVHTQAVPEPASMLALAAGFGGLVARRRSRRK